MSKRLNDICTDVDLKFDIKRIKTITNETINRIPEERDILVKHKKIKIILAAAVLIASGFATVFAGGGLISYFMSDKAVEVTDIDELEKHNENIDISVSKDGYVLTLDSLAIDDNFLHVFYTITSLEGELWENENIRPFINCRINGHIIGNTNGGRTSGYYVDDYTYKTVVKYNISQMDIPETFLFEMYSSLRYDELSNFEDGYLYREYLELTDEDKAKLVYISLETKKSTIETENINYEPHQQFVYSDFDGNDAVGEISKIVFSPFGSQFVVTDNNGGLGARRVMDMAMQDDRGEFLDILITNLTGAAADEDGYFIEILPETVKENTEYSNSIEFLKGSSDMKYFDLIPSIGSGERKISNKTDEYPIIYEINEYGKIIVTEVVIKDGGIDVHYYKDGFVKGDPEFIFLDENGRSIEFGNLPAKEYQVNYDTDSYIFSYYYFDFDSNGRKALPSDGSLSKESLEQRLDSLEVVADSEYTLDYDKAVRVELK